MPLGVGPQVLRRRHRRPDRSASASPTATTCRRRAIRSPSCSASATASARPTRDDFQIFDQTQLLAAASTISGTLTLLLGGIASIALIVGGIGIMNIMLVSVRERTREIGIRKALGARGRDILSQFLIEALTLSLIGGLIGVLLGLVVSAVIGSDRRLGLHLRSRTRSPSPRCSAWPSASSSGSGRPARPPASIPSSPSATSRRSHPWTRIRRTSPAAVPTSPVSPRRRHPLDAGARAMPAQQPSSRDRCAKGPSARVGSTSSLAGALVLAVGGIGFAAGRMTAPAARPATDPRHLPGRQLPAAAASTATSAAGQGGNGGRAGGGAILGGAGGGVTIEGTVESVSGDDADPQARLRADDPGRPRRDHDLPFPDGCEPVGRRHRRQGHRPASTSVAARRPGRAARRRAPRPATSRSSRRRRTASPMHLLLVEDDPAPPARPAPAARGRSPRRGGRPGRPDRRSSSSRRPAGIEAVILDLGPAGHVRPRGRPPGPRRTARELDDPHADRPRHRQRPRDRPRRRRRRLPREAVCLRGAVGAACGRSRAGSSPAPAAPTRSSPPVRSRSTSEAGGSPSRASPIDLSPREFSLLECFLRHPGQSLTRDQLLDQAWPF